MFPPALVSEVHSFRHDNEVLRETLSEVEGENRALLAEVSRLRERLDEMIVVLGNASHEVHWFRSLLKDGTVWCESKRLDEVLRMSEGEDCTFESRLVLHGVALPWRPAPTLAGEVGR